MIGTLGSHTLSTPPTPIAAPDAQPDAAVGEGGVRGAASARSSALAQIEVTLFDKTEMLQATLNSMNQGIFMVDADGRIITYNTKVCEMLDLPESLLARRATLQEVTVFQLRRGDFGDNAHLVEDEARGYVIEASRHVDVNRIPFTYQRKTLKGRILDVESHALPNGGMVRIFTDVTDFTQIEAARKQLFELLDITQSMARVGGMAYDVLQDRVFWTDGTFQVFETSPAEFVPTTYASIGRFFEPESLAVMKGLYLRDEGAARSHDLELRMVTAKGRRIWVHSRGTTEWKDGVLVKRTAVIQDISERVLAETSRRESERRWKLALDSAGDGVWDWNIQTGEEFFSAKMLAIYGFGENELANLAEEFDRRTHPDDLEQLYKDRQAHFDNLTPTYNNEHRVRCKDGTWKWVLSRGMVIERDTDGKPLRMIGTHTDITRRKEAEVMIWKQAFFDTLTELPNRRMLIDRLGQEIRSKGFGGQRFALLFIDLDHFKEVNDTLGHHLGDQILVEAARRLRECVSSTDMVARMGGDEFTLILSDINDSTELRHILQRMLSAMERAFEIDGERAFVSASIGVTLFPQDGTEVHELLKHADQALYEAKGAGRNRYSFFTAALQQAAQARVRLANDLRAGLAAKEFWLAFQPIVEFSTGAVHKAEALLRWEHPTQGYVPPGTFIPIAESSGLIEEIGEWVFQQAAQHVRDWRQSLHPSFQISVNKSPVQFQNQKLTRKPWSEQLIDMGLACESMVVEITEGLLLDSTDSVVAQLADLQAAGVGVSLDDFGTGYSALSYLQKFHIDFVKIDQSFVRHLDDGSTNLALCKAIIRMAHELGMKVIAEGVETVQQRDLLAAAGCDYGQGYLFARPMPAKDFEAFMVQHQANAHPWHWPAG